MTDPRVTDPRVTAIFDGPECAYCGYPVEDGAVLVTSGLCTGCDRHPPVCASPGRHEAFCDCADGICE